MSYLSERERIDTARLLNWIDDHERYYLLNPEAYKRLQELIAIQRRVQSDKANKAD